VPNTTFHMGKLSPKGHQGLQKATQQGVGHARVFIPAHLLPSPSSLLPGHPLPGATLPLRLPGWVGPSGKESHVLCRPGAEPLPSSPGDISRAAESILPLQGLGQWELHGLLGVTSLLQVLFPEASLHPANASQSLQSLHPAALAEPV
jgi:hypothetical protein